MILDASRDNTAYIVDYLKAGKTCVLPTDTLYGFSCSAYNKTAVDSLYEIKGRQKNKPFIILIPDVQELENFSVALDETKKKYLRNAWPGALTVVLPSTDLKYDYLHKGIFTLAFRIPAHLWVCDLLSRTGALISTSVNTSGEPPLDNFNDIVESYNDKIDLFINDGPKQAVPSTIIEFNDNTINVIRQGAVKINNFDLTQQITS